MACQHMRVVRLIHAALLMLVRLVELEQLLQLLGNERFVKTNGQRRRFMHATKACQALRVMCRVSPV